ncbi:hypothetical protein CYLTODRAFT_493680 [Cylindrobasidium torrendii FP15055 ss-10]|uniref:Uncharacterized protein n=1 Tax=Cylindrobasidium torrendii FP15055 ss-10 TaxID=1314674 RepID=A0A0D7AZF4_9AGAR|nr:hypothetical protein CYLTODRAFT_493680 [Cylindrobasidium torrendii FP15055 ss-10]
MASSTNLQSIEDWDTYIGASRKGEQPLSTGSLESTVKSLFQSVLDGKGQIIGDPNLLRRPFQTWRAILDAYDADESSSTELDPPFMLMVRLRGKYPQGVSLSSLTPGDQHIVLQFAPLAKAYEFDFHLANAKYSESGRVSWKVRRSRYGHGYLGRGYGRGNGRYGHELRTYYDTDEDEDSEDLYDDPCAYSYHEMGYYDSDEDPDINKLDLDDVTEIETMLYGIVALDGKPMSCDDCPKDLDEVMISGSLYSGDPAKEFKRYKVGSGWLTHTHTTSVLVITPSEYSDDFVDGNIYPWACAKLLASISTAPTPKEAELVQLLLEYLPSAEISSIDRTGAAKALRNTADRWGDTDLFVRACRACGLELCLEAMSIEGMASACQAFDWVNLSSIFTEVYEQSTSSAARRQLITALLTSSADSDDKEIAQWCRTLSANALDDIQQLDTDGVPWAVAILHSEVDPVAYARDELFPQLVKMQPQELSVWKSLFSAVSVSTRPEAERKAMGRVIKMTLGTLAHAIPAYPSYTKSPGVTVKFPAELLDDFIFLCFRYDMPEAMSLMFDRMWQERELQQLRVAEGGYPPSQYYAAIVDLLTTHTSAKPELRPYLYKFYQHATDLLLSNLTDKTTVGTLLAAIKNTADPILTLYQMFTASRVCELGKNRESLKLTVEAISKDLRPLTTSSNFNHFEHVLTTCLAELTHTFNNKTISHSSGVQPATELIQLCFTLKLPTLATYVLAKFVSGPEANKKEYIQRSLVGILKVLRGILRPHNALIDEMPWSAFTADVLKRYTRHVLGARPAFTAADSKINGLSCGCSLCTTHLLPILLSSDTSGKIQQNGFVRTHIEKRLAPAKAWGLQWETSKSHWGAAHTLVIKKPAAMAERAAWNVKGKEARKILSLLGSAAAQAIVLDKDYGWVIGTIKGNSKPPPESVAMGQTVGMKQKAAEAVDARARKKARLS